MALLGTLLAIVGGYYSVQLYKNLRTDIEELLPTTARSVLDLNEVTQRLESIDSLGVLIFSRDTVASRRFVDDLAARLKKVPRNVIASVEYRIDRELEFFRKRQALYIELADLIKVRNYIDDRIEYEKELYNPLNIFSEREIPEPKLDFLALRQKYQGRTSSYEKLPDGYYATPDETIRTILVYMPGKTSSIDQVHRLKDAVVEAVDALKPQSYAPDLEVKYTGGVQDTLEEHLALIADLELSTVLVLVAVTLAMFLFFRSFLAPIALMVSLLMGTVWTFGVSYFAVGYLNANSAFLGSIVIGNGINFGIIFLARYMEERRKGNRNSRATMVAMAHTATATWTAALAAGLAYGSLILTGFRGFRQFGVIGLIGMVLCWISAFTLLPAFLAIADRFHPLVKGRREPARSYLAGGVAKLIERAPWAVWLFSIALTVASLATFSRLDNNIIETNLSNLRNKDSMERGSGYLSKYQDQIFQRYLAPVVLLPHSREDALRIAQKLKEKKQAEGKDSMIASVQTLEDFIPDRQVAKIEILQEIRHLLPPRLVQRLSAQDQRLVSQFLSPEAMRPVREKELPDLIIRKFTEKDGSLGKLVLVEPPLGNALWDGDKLIAFVKELREVADSVAPGTPVAGTVAITSDMILSITQDGPKATLFAFLAVVVLVIVLFRNVASISLILGSLMLGALWLGGFVLGFGHKINFLNFIALPITFGIGVDYSVNIFQRYREEGSKNILRVIRNTGGAVGLCSFTTVVGYTSLLIAGNQGFVSFGVLAVVGEFTCLMAAMFSVPAYLIIRSRRSRHAQR